VSDRAELRIRAVTDPGDPILDGALAIYEDSIPANERKPTDALRALASSPDHLILVASRGDTALGFLLLFIGESAALLEYLAVAAAARGGGIGALLFDRARREAAPRALLVEVEADLEGGEDQAMQVRRLGFYSRLGCRRVEGLDYVSPLSPPSETPPMYLLVLGLEQASVPRATVETWLREMYARVYGQDEDDSRVAFMLGSLPSAAALV
jgi:GNAT superfamily N-acetyltransferase